MKLCLALLCAAIAMPGYAQTTPAPTDPVGGYQPANPPVPRPPGVPIVFVQAPPPEVAYPPPAPLPDYPFCKPGQFDKCKQRHDPK
ncbi:MAG: hypothetical protein E7773_12570 [Sphingomonas sp.]|uniref:hypothetical protein n=1 Tax=Sphingomonas sp. TaxID=28214 RepID=UPI001203D45A|nr:hypothetical protein [Sphingomonas sp.]THD35273.1 MAG: hypothetical protein E7773_12570 [Sphingomonas sp.]